MSEPEPADFSSHSYRLGWLEHVVRWALSGDRDRDDEYRMRELLEAFRDYERRCGN